jgi:TRAP-type C4-dicarboxylate transport system permease small subunit
MYLAFGIALVIVGASIMTVITAAEDSRTEGIDVSGIGWTLLVGGALTLVLALIHRARRPDRNLQIEHEAPADRRGEWDAA